MTTLLSDAQAPLVELTPAVLIVDDEVKVCSAVQRVLDRQGVTVHAAYGAEEGLARLERLDVQLVISDLKMPGYDGIWFLSRVRKLRPRVQRVLLTGMAELDDARRAINLAGVHRFLTKPWDHQALIDTVLDCIETWRIQAERDALHAMIEEHNRVLETRVGQRTIALERASRTWRNTFDAIADPLALVDDGYRIVRANLAAADAAGEGIKALIGRRCHEALFGRAAPCEGCLLDGGRHRAEPGAAVEVGDERRGRVWRMTAWPLGEDEPGDLDRDVAVCHYRDITQERELQRQVLAMEKIAAVGELAGCVAHELNNPLTAILTFSQIIGRQGKSAGEEIALLGQDIEEAARRCKNIVQSLLEYARPGGQPAPFVAVDLPELVDGCLRLVGYSQPELAQVRVSRSTHRELPLVRGNPDGLKSVVLNLVGNALQAMGGEGTLRVELEPVPGEAAVRLRVADSGPGIPDEIRDKIFKPFFTTKAKNKTGTGLGLAIVRNVVREHGGSIEVGAGPDGGACFTVCLPAHTARQGA